MGQDWVPVSQAKLDRMKAVRTALVRKPQIDVRGILETEMYRQPCEQASGSMEYVQAYSK
jgi:hypothetical protein